MRSNKVLHFFFLLPSVQGWSSFQGTPLTLNARVAPLPARSASLVTMMATPVISDWKLSNGRVVGIVRNHPVIENGDTITTSPLADPSAVKPNSVVETKSGSKYKLAQPANGYAPPKAANGVAKAPEKAKKPAPVVAPPPPPTPRSRAVSKPQQPAPAPAAVSSPADDAKALKKAQADAKRTFDLNGQIVGDKYLLAGKPIRSTSGKSSIWTAYVSDENQLPVGEALTVKVSPNTEALSRETKNYGKVTGLVGQKGKFVKFNEYIIPAGKGKPLNTQCAIVMERGNQDLKAYIAENGALSGKQLREAAVAAVQCLQALHGSGLVWTDMKTENFVTVGAANTIKGIDLESAMPCKENPVDYSPEACPPEFAETFLSGNGPYFVLEYSYDIWSLGMLLYEISTGKGLFEGKAPAQITKILKDPQWVVDVSQVSDSKLQDLIASCLQINPKARPSLPQILLHPYFLTTGIGPFSF